MDSVTEVISEFIQLNFISDGSEIDADTSFSESGVVDSVGMLEVILFIEERFGVTVDDRDVTREQFDSIAGLAAYVEAKQSGRPLGTPVA